MANEGPLPQADLLALYRRLFAATRALEARDRADARDGRTGRRRLTPSLPRGGADPLRPGPDRVPASRPRRERDLGLGRGPRGRRRGSCCGSRTTTGSAAGRSTTRRCSRTSPGSGSRRRRPGPPVRRMHGGLRGGARPAARRRPRLRLRLHRGRRSRRGRSTGPWRGPGCPGGCRERAARTARPARRARGRRGAVDGRGPRARAPATSPRERATSPIRDRHGNWTYGFAVVVDDLRQAIDLVVRGEDLLRRDAGADPARPAAGSRRAAGVRPPPADPQTGRRQAVEGRPATPASASCAAPGSARGRHRRRGRGGRADPELAAGVRGRRVVAHASSERSRGAHHAAPTDPRSPRRGRARARRSGGRRTEPSTCGRRAASRRTACRGRRARRRPHGLDGRSIAPVGRRHPEADLAGVRAIGLHDVPDHLVAVAAAATRALAQFGRRRCGHPIEHRPGRLDQVAKRVGRRQRVVGRRSASVTRLGTPNSVPPSPAASSTTSKRRGRRRRWQRLEAGRLATVAYRTAYAARASSASSGVLPDRDQPGQSMALANAFLGVTSEHDVDTVRSTTRSPPRSRATRRPIASTSRPSGPSASTRAEATITPSAPAGRSPGRAPAG